MTGTLNFLLLVIGWVFLVCNFCNLWELWLFKLLASILLPNFLKFGHVDICMYTLKLFLSVCVRSSWVCHYDQHKYSWMYLPIFLISMSLHMFPFLTWCILSVYWLYLSIVLHVYLTSLLEGIYILCSSCDWNIWSTHMYIISYVPDISYWMYMCF